MEMNYLNFELLGLLIIGILSLRIKNREFNHNLIKIVFLVLLVINPFQLFFLIESPNFLLMIAIVITSEIIITHNLALIIIKPNHDQLFQSTILIITSSLIGIASSSNLLVLVGWFACLIYFFMINYFTSGEPKEFDDYLRIIISFSIGIVVLLISSIILLFSMDSANLNGFVALNSQLSFIILVLLLLGFGILGGIFPFNLFFSRFHADSDFKSLSIYMIIQYTSLFSLFRLFSMIDKFLLQFGLILLLLGALGSIISIYKTLNDFFFNFGSKKSSLRNVLGNSFILDFNNLLLLSSLFFISDISSFSLFLLLIFFIFLAKFLLIVPIYYRMREFDTDDLNKIGNLFQQDRFLGIISLISGLIIAFPSSALSFNLILNALSSPIVQFNSILFVIVIVILIIYSIYILANIMIHSSISIKINFNLKIREDN